jgi:hypothetical protein
MDAPGCLRCGKAWLRRDGPKKLDARNWNGWAEADRSWDGWKWAGQHKAEARLAGCNWSEARWNAACSNAPGR